MRVKPSITIGINYLERWHLVPRNRFINVYLHKFSGSDDDRALHDHPWASLSFLLKGKLREVYPVIINGMEFHPQRMIPRFKPVFRSASYAHRLEIGREPAWTLFITGPKVREWGFLCASGWRHWTLMSTSDGKPIGGCDEGQKELK